jgi:purine-binding chemotaxis protein CheW
VVIELELDGEPATLGLLVDSVSDVIDLLPEEIEPPPAFGTRIKVDYLSGMARTERKFTMILDIDRALSIDEILAVNDLRTDGSENIIATNRESSSSELRGEAER